MDSSGFCPGFRLGEGRLSITNTHQCQKCSAPSPWQGTGTLTAGLPPPTAPNPQELLGNAVGISRKGTCVNDNPTPLPASFPSCKPRV